MALMPWDSEHGCNTPGKTGAATHLGDPLTVEQIRELPDGAEVVITWDGGNGPHPYRILVDYAGERRVEGLYCDAILKWPDQTNPLHRVTLGWDETARAYFDDKVPLPEHILEKIRWWRTGSRGDDVPESGMTAGSWRVFHGDWSYDGDDFTEGEPGDWTHLDERSVSWDRASGVAAERLRLHLDGDCPPCQAEATDELARLATLEPSTEWLGHIEGDDLVILRERP